MTLIEQASHHAKYHEEKEAKMKHLEEKFEKLKEIIEGYAPVAIAFSGGVDSTFLLKVAYDLLGDKACAITVNSPYIATWEIDEADALTKTWGVEHMHLNFGLPEAIKMNPENRCYLCKTEIFSAIKTFAREHDFREVLDGSNADDLLDYRPGMKALKELDIKSPLLEAGFTKEEIRTLSKKMGLPTWDKPPYACLLTRLPYHTEIVVEDIRKIETAEKFLMDRGIKGVRVRKHDKLARIEIAHQEFDKILDAALMSEINLAFKAIGFSHVTLDLGGYQMGNFNQDVKRGETS